MIEVKILDESMTTYDFTYGIQASQTRGPSRGRLKVGAWHACMTWETAWELRDYHAGSRIRSYEIEDRNLSWIWLKKGWDMEVLDIYNGFMRRCSEMIL